MMRRKCAPSAPETIPAEREMQDEIRKYCDSVCSRIRWKKARRPVAEELASHICDQRDAYLRAGLKEEEAVCRAVLDMGNPEETGEALDRIHRPAPQWKFLIFAVCALSAGLAARLFSVAFSGGSGDLPMTAWIETTAALLVICILYRIDFSALIRHGRVIFSASCIVVLCGIFLFLDAGSIKGLLGNYSHISCAACLLFPVLYTAYLCSPEKYEKRWKKTAADIFAWLIPAVFLTLCAEPALYLIFYMLSVLLITAFFAFQSRRMPENIFPGLLAAETVSGGVLVCLSFFLHRGQPFFVFWSQADGDVSGHYSMIYNLLPHISFLGTDLPVQDVQEAVSWISDSNLAGESLLFVLTLRFGWSIFIVIIGLFVCFLAAGFRRAAGLKTEPGRMTALSVLTVLSAQVICYVLCHFGIVFGTSLSLPLFSGGSALLLADSILIGLLLSVFRTEEIKKMLKREEM